MNGHHARAVVPSNRASALVAAGCLILWGWLVAAGSAAVAQGVLPFRQLRPMPLIQMLGPPADAAGEAIGDPWWDEAEAKQPAAKPAEKAAEDAGGEPAADAGDAQALMRQQLRAQVEALAQNVRQQALTILRRELSLVRQTCPSLERQQRALVLQAGREAIDRAGDEQMQAAVGPGRRRAKRADLETSIRNALRASVAANATDAELAAYEAEHRMRTDRRKAAAVAAVVALVDRDAYLDDAEREALAASLAESYRDRWRTAVAAMQQQVVMADESILPGVERCVEKALGKERKAQWLAARDEARKLAGAPGMPQMQMVGGVLQIQGGNPPIPRVFRQRIEARGDGVQMQLEVGGAFGGFVEEAEEAEPAAAEDEK